MNMLFNDRNELVVSEGAPGSIIRMGVAYPELIEKINQRPYARGDWVHLLSYDGFSKMEAENLLQNTKFKV